MADQTLASLTAATPTTGGLLYGTQSSADRKFTLSPAGAALAEATDAAAQRTALGLDTAALRGVANTFTAAQTISGAALTLSGNQSAPAWATNGVRLRSTAGTLTDTTSAGTVSTAYTNRLGGNTIAATNATTFTNYVTSYHNSPTAGTNVTFGQRWGLGTDLMLVNGNGAASQPALALTGTPFTGGSATTTLPLLYYTNGGTANFNTNGTILGMTMPSGFSGDAIRINYSSGANMLTVDQNGSINCNYNIAASGSISTLTALFGNSVGATGTGLTLNTANTIGWSPTGLWYSTPDLYLSRKGTASLGLGVASATPIAQTLGGADGSGTNITGGTLNIGTRGTGTGTGGSINLQYHAAGSSGSTLGTLVDVLSVVGVGRIRITSIPTSASGLTTGDVWSNAGILTIV